MKLIIKGQEKENIELEGDFCIASVDGKLSIGGSKVSINDILDQLAMINAAVYDVIHNVTGDKISKLDFILELNGRTNEIFQCEELESDIKKSNITVDYIGLLEQFMNDWLNDLNDDDTDEI